MEIKDLRYFVAVYEEKGFSRAAGALGTVQSNVSMRIAALESSLGVTLFERRHRGIAPTAAGEMLYCQAKQLLAEVEKTERMVRPPLPGTATLQRLP